MKRLIFITLKILEVLCIPVAYFVLAIFGYLIEFLIHGENLFNWYHPFPILYSLLVLTIGCIVVAILFGSIPKWIESNKKLTDKIYKKLKK